MALIRYGQSIVFSDPFRAPWWFSLIVVTAERIKNIQEAGAQDIEKMTAPKSIFFDDKELELWFDEREKVRRRKLREPEPLDDEY
jgi:hypothetical protein